MRAASLRFVTSKHADPNPEWPHRTRGLLFAGATALLWSVLAIALKYSLKFADVDTIVWFRFLCAFVLLLLLLGAFRREHVRILRAPPALALLAAVCLAANYRFYFKGLELAGAGSAQVLIQSAPLMLALIGVLAFHERLRVIQRWGFLVAVVGLGFFYADQSGRTPEGGRYAQGVAAIAVGALTWALWAALQKVLIRRGHAPQALNLLTYAVAAVAFVPLVDWAQLAGLDVGGWALLVFLGVNTLLAYGSMTEALKYAPANQVSIIITLNPLVTLILLAALDAANAAFIDPEPVSAVGYLGACCMLAGVVLVVRRRSAPPGAGTRGSRG